MKRGMGLIATTLVAGFVLAGCQPGPPPTSSPAVPTPTFACTPEAGGPESPCTQAQYDQMKAKDELYAEAEAVYRQFFAENIRISRAGGVNEPTAAIQATTIGAAQDSVMTAFKGLLERHSIAKGQDPVLTIRREPGASRAGSVIALVGCVDARKWGFYRGSAKTSDGRAAEDRVYFNRTDAGLKMATIEGRWVASCDA